MPRQRPRRRRRRSEPTESPTRNQIDEELNARTDVSRRRRWLPPASVVTSLGLGIWLGWAFAGAGGIVEDVVLWVGVLMAGLGGGRLLRRSLQRRQDARDRQTRGG